MSKTYKNQKGFTAAEVLVVLVVVVLIVLVGWMAYKTHNKTNKVTSLSAKRVSSELKYEKIYYEYPSNWKVTDQSVSSANGGCVEPGVDHVYLTSPSNEQVELWTGEDCSGDSGSTTFGAIPIRAFGQSLYLAFEGGNGDGPAATSPDTACLAKTADPNSSFDFQSKHITSSTTSLPVNSFCYWPYNVLKQTTPKLTVQSIKDSKDFNTAKLIFESMHY